MLSRLANCKDFAAHSDQKTGTADANNADGGLFATVASLRSIFVPDEAHCLIK